MKIAVTSIQRDRNPWIVEWLAFHMLVGFNQFYIYSHKCRDGMSDTLLKLTQRYPIQVYGLESDDKPQLAAYHHAWNTHGQDVDWMAFIDGDEFLFSTAQSSMAEALAPYAGKPLSALAVYWMCYGSSGHIEEPAGLIMENYTRHSARSFQDNRHIKSIVRGGQQIEIASSHLFRTPHGTYDEQMRLITDPIIRDNPDAQPSWDKFRINHYSVQSYSFFKQTKQNMGVADFNAAYVRPHEWFHKYDRNECDDGVSYNFLVRLKLKVRELRAAIEEVSLQQAA
ncbi:glycosyltransferase family 2 protein [Cupriavidus pinatubonensis]|uniref:Glycosyl transferase, family 2 n=1 Tax=Cupriavidus pinatubonensis TaxID=248026 RepID=A0ABM8WY92_9BURK|nr:glycosyltransferase family 2 protein [Cupriavidus pinatubonensis]CAG9172518.1 hypothetical protein LMG23994_02425 [Cupriavidus pinatubonensis]